MKDYEKEADELVYKLYQILPAAIGRDRNGEMEPIPDEKTALKVLIFCLKEKIKALEPYGMFIKAKKYKEQIEYLEGKL